MNREQRRPHLGIDGLPSAAQRRTDRDHMTDEVWPLTRKRAGDQSAKAMADDSNPASRLFRNFFQTTQHALDLALRASNVEAYSRQISSIADLLKPSRHR